MNFSAEPSCVFGDPSSHQDALLGAGRSGVGWAARSGASSPSPTSGWTSAPQVPGGLLAGAGLSVRIDDIRSVSWRNLRARLGLDVGAAPIVLEGSLITRLAVALHAMGVP